MTRAKNYSDRYGPPVLFCDSEIMRMLKLADTSETDVLFDLGCGFARNLIVAARKFGVRKCLGVEQIRNRCESAKEEVARHSLSQRIRIIHGDIGNLLQGKVKGVQPFEATVVLYTIVTTKRVLKLFSHSLSEGCRLVYYARNGVFPEIKPNAVDYPFYMSVFPFDLPSSERDWLTSILVDENVRSLSVSELWSRVGKKLGLNSRDIKGYQKRCGKSHLKSR